MTIDCSDEYNNLCASSRNGDDPSGGSVHSTMSNSYGDNHSSDASRKDSRASSTPDSNPSARVNAIPHKSV